MTWRLAAVLFLALWVPACALYAVLHARRGRMPKRSKPAVRLAAEGGRIRPTRILRFGHGDRGPVAWHTYAEPHLAAAGHTGKGKTVALRNIIRAALAGGWDVYLIDPKGFEFIGFTGHPGVCGIADEGPEMTRMIHAVKVELTKRQHERKVYELTSKPDDDPLVFTPILLVVDEVTELVQMTGGKAKSSALADLGSIMRLGRALDIHVAVATQRLDVKEALPGSVRDQCDAQLGVGHLGPQGARMLWGDTRFDTVPVKAPPGRGVFVAAHGWARAVQVDYADPPRPVRSHPLSGLVDVGPSGSTAVPPVVRRPPAPAPAPTPGVASPASPSPFRSGRQP